MERPTSGPAEPPSDALLTGVRRRLLDMLDASPGLHLRELERRLGVPQATLRHHLERLRTRGLVEAYRDGRLLRFFPAGEMEGREALAALRQEPLRRALLLLLQAGGESDYRALAARADVPQSTLSTRLSALQARGLATLEKAGRETRWRLVAPQAVARVLREHRESLADPEVDAVLARLDAG